VTKPGRYFFDECLGRPAMRELARIVPGNPQFTHVLDVFDQGTTDDVWVPRMAADGGWIVISSDRGRQSGLGAKLPWLCQEHKITHILLSTALHKKKSHEKVAALALIWSDIESVAAAPPGTRFKLRIRQSKGIAGLKVVLERAS
jgi:hypothetical protein